MQSPYVNENSRNQFVNYCLCLVVLLNLVTTCNCQEKLTVKQFREGLKEGKFDAVVDVRTTAEWEYIGHIPNATFVPRLNTPIGDPSPLKGCENCTLAVYCHSGVRAAKAITKLKTQYGFHGKLYNALGVMQWQDEGHKLVHTSSLPAACNRTNDICNNCDNCLSKNIETIAPTYLRSKQKQS